MLEGILGTSLPCVASHEGAGTIVAVGSSVSGFKQGDRILCSLNYHRCGVCTDCTGPEHEQHYCASTGGYLGIHRDGFFAEYEVVDGRECSLLPDNLSFESAAPLACAGITICKSASHVIIHSVFSSPECSPKIQGFECLKVIGNLQMVRNFNQVQYLKWSECSN